MKAKQYAARLINTTDTESAKTELAQIGRDFLDEFIAIKNARNCKFDRALIPLMKDFDMKWRSFCVHAAQRFEGLDPNGFLKLAGIAFGNEIVKLYLDSKKEL